MSWVIKTVRDDYTPEACRAADNRVVGSLSEFYDAHYKELDGEGPCRCTATHETTYKDAGIAIQDDIIYPEIWRAEMTRVDGRGPFTVYITAIDLPAARDLMQRCWPNCTHGSFVSVGQLVLPFRRDVIAKAVEKVIGLHPDGDAIVSAVMDTWK
jgi:hypothetical protein